MKSPHGWMRLAVLVLVCAGQTANARDPEMQIQMMPGKARVNWTIPPR